MVNHQIKTANIDFCLNCQIKVPPIFPAIWYIYYSLQEISVYISFPWSNLVLDVNLLTIPKQLFRFETWNTVKQSNHVNCNWQCLHVCNKQQQQLQVPTCICTCTCTSSQTRLECEYYIKHYYYIKGYSYWTRIHVYTVPKYHTCL